MALPRKTWEQWDDIKARNIGLPDSHYQQNLLALTAMAVAYGCPDPITVAVQIMTNLRDEEIDLHSLQMKVLSVMQKEADNGLG